MTLLIMGLYLIIACAGVIRQEAMYAEVIFIKDERFEKLPGYKNMEMLMWVGFWLSIIGLFKLVFTWLGVF